MIPQAIALPTRAVIEKEGRPPGSPPLEFVHWPIFSCAAFNTGALPRSVDLFNYLPGQTISGAGPAAIAATELHTNMQASRAIPAPKTFVISSIRVMVPPVVYTSTVGLSNPSVDTALENDDQADDLTLIRYAMALKFSIGEKVYAEAPLFQMPENIGVGGIAATSVHANATQVVHRRVALHTKGVGYGFSTGRRPVLWASQTFQCQLIADWTTNPSLVDTHLVYVMLDGVMGRELQ